MAAYKRVLLKISGEALAGPQGFGLDAATVNFIAQEIVSVYRQNVQIGVVCGGGNFIRGDAFSSEGNIERTVADQMGMLSTIINALALQAGIERHDVQTRVQSAILVTDVCEPFIRRRAIRHMEKGRVVVFAAGTGNPYFTTDSASVLRALEIEAEVLFKATKVDGVYNKDPRRFDDAVKYERLTFTEAINQRLAVMDQTAFTMCREHNLPVAVFDLNTEGNMKRAVLGEPVGTIVQGE
ncbi:MAG: UMP kinase [Fimbriimonadaceae bacterium]